MPEHNLKSRIKAARAKIDESERELQKLLAATDISPDEVIEAARDKLTSAREHLLELDGLLAADALDQARTAVADAEDNLRAVLDELVVPERTSTATDIVMDALSRLDLAKTRLGVLEDD